MRAELLVFWLVATSLSAAPRDPFQPATRSFCETPPAVLTGWRLRGVLGREPLLRAWLVSPQNAIVRVASTEPFPLPGWQVGALSRRSLTLTTRHGCLPQDTTFSLKGVPHAQDGTFSAGVRLFHPRAGQ